MFRTNISRALFFVAGTVVFYSPLKAAEQAPAAVQVERGRQLFHKTFKSYSCATCHSIEGTGTAVGPNLKTLGSVVGPPGPVYNYHDVGNVLRTGVPAGQRQYLPGY